VSKSKKPTNKRDQFMNEGGRKSKTTYMVVGLAIVLLLAAIGFYLKSAGNSVGLKPDPREAKYIGRYLPKGYAPAKLIEPIGYEERIDPTDINPEIKDGSIQLNVGDIIKNRIVYFEYTRAGDNTVIPMTAYIKPSGKLFTGVSLCRPCQAKRQYIDSDGLLTCTACGTKRDLETQAGVSGACKLYPLDEMPHSLLGGKVLISENSLGSWKEQPLDRSNLEQ
jgi:hypothetical protein